MLRPRKKWLWGYPVYDTEDTTPSGLILPNRKEKIMQTLEVAMVGPDVVDIEPGDIVILDSKKGGEVVTLMTAFNEAVKVYCIHEDAAIAVVE